MKKINKRGFTLIELLVVIAIIGLLSTMAVVSLNSARQKARDAKRVSDVKQMSTLLSLAASELPDATLRCTVIGTLCADGASTTAIVGARVGTGASITDPDLEAEFNKFVDPSADTSTMCAPAGAIGAQSIPCSYALEIHSGTNNIETARIVFMTENAVGSLAGDTVHSINSEGIMVNDALVH